MPSVRIIINLTVADENEAAKIVASLEAQFPDRHIPSQYFAELGDGSASLEKAREELVDPIAGAMTGAKVGP